MTLHAGPIQVYYDHGFLRYFKYADSEVLRMIYFALRNENWATYKPHIENETLDIQPDHFKISYDCFHERDGHRIYTWKVNIHGHPNGTIEFEIHGLALKEVIRNRAGLCILHPIHGLAGQPCTIEHPDGSREQANFPFHIEPKDPFQLIQSMRWNFKGHEFNLDFEGDLFETEDQRNWSDASYKTFCTPLSLPFPVLLKPGDTVYQKAVFKPVKNLPVLPSKKDKIVIRLTEQILHAPQVGIGASTSLENMNDQVISAIRNLKLDHYRIEIFPETKEWKSKCIRDVQNARSLYLPLYMALHLHDSGKEQVDEVIQWSLGQEIQPACLLLLTEGKPVTSPEVNKNLLALRSVFPDALIGAGTDFGFTEINRNRFDASGLDFISFPVNPQMHSVDALTIIENIGTQEELIRSAHEIFGPSMAIHVSPLTLRSRPNPNAMHEPYDPRQLSPFAAAFTLGSLKALSIGRCSSVTLYQTAGPQGVVSASGKPHPVYEAIRIWNQISSHLYHSISSHPLLVDSLYSQKDQSKTLTLFNYTEVVQTVYLDHQSVELNPLEIKTIHL